MMEEQFINIDGHKIRYLESGTSEKTLVLIHGLGASSERWTPVIPSLSKNFHVIIPDLIGFGYSDKPLVDYTIDYFLDFLDKFFITCNISNLSLMGSSLGGQICAEYAAIHPQKIEKLILISPSGIMKQSTASLDAYIMAALYPNEQNAKNAFELMENSGRKIDQKIINDFITRMSLPNAKLAFMSTVLGLKNSEVITKKLQSIVTPTMVLWGKQDPVIPISYSGDFTSSIKNCFFYQMDNCGHTPYAQDPVAFSSIVLDFLQNGRI